MTKGEPWILEFYNPHVEKQKWEPLRSWAVDHRPLGFSICIRKHATRFNMDDAIRIGQSIESELGIQIRMKNLWTREIILTSVL